MIPFKSNRQIQKYLNIQKIRKLLQLQQRKQRRRHKRESLYEEEVEDVVEDVVKDVVEEKEVLQGRKRDRTLLSKPTKPQRVVVTVNDDGAITIDPL